MTEREQAEQALREAGARPDTPTQWVLNGKYIRFLGKKRVSVTMDVSNLTALLSAVSLDAVREAARMVLLPFPTPPPWKSADHITDAVVYYLRERGER